MSGADLVHKLQRDLNCLSDPDRSTRRRALERLQKRLLFGDPGDAAAPSPHVLQAAWDDVILRLVVRVLSDSVEKCRELAILLISSVSKALPEVDQTVIQIMPVMTERMGQSPILEGSEEIRLHLLNLLATSLLSQCPPDVCFSVKDDCFKVLIASIADQFHEIKKGACKVIVLIGELAPKTLEGKTESLVKALLLNMNHSHFRVRMAVLQAVDAVFRMGLSKTVVCENLVPGVKPLGFDRSTGLREIFFVSVARWLGWEENSKGGRSLVLADKDRTVNIAQLFPLLLLGVTDESKDVAAKSLSSVEGVGIVYEQYSALLNPSTDKTMGDAVEGKTVTGHRSPEDELERGVDEINENCDDGDIYGELLLPAPFVKRPSVGCRRMAQAFLGKLLGPIIKDLHGWTTVTRLGAARLLHSLMILAEEHSTDHLDVLVPAFISAVGDDELAIAQHVISAVQLLGFHTKAEFSLPLVLDVVTTPASSDAKRANGLVVMAGLLFGTPKHRIQETLVMQVSDGLSEGNVRCSDHPGVQRQLLAVLTNLLDVAEELCKSSSLKMFLVLLQLQSVEGDGQLQQGAVQLADALARVVGLTSAQDLYQRHVGSLIPLVTSRWDEWMGHSPVKALFQTFMKSAGSAVGRYLGNIAKMFGDCLHEDRDPALRISLLQIHMVDSLMEAVCIRQLLDDLLENEQLAPWWPPLTEQIILGILVPCGVWRIGKVGAAIRHRSMVALGTFLRRDLCSQGQLLDILKSEKGMLGVVISCLDEDYYVDTRRATCHVLQNVIRIAGFAMEDIDRSTITPELLKRLDDSSDAVRLGILPAIAAFFDTMPGSLSDDAVRAFLSDLLVHMDDANQQIQEAVCMVGETCALRRPKLVADVAANFRTRHRTTRYCDHLIAYSASVTPGTELPPCDTFS